MIAVVNAMRMSCAGIDGDGMIIIVQERRKLP